MLLGYSLEPRPNSRGLPTAGSVVTIGLLRATRGAHNPNLQVVITHASHVCSQHSFGFSLRMNGMHRTQFDHARLDLSLVICHA